MSPSLDDLLDRLHVVALPMRVRFRGITVREVALIDGPAGWGEFSAFVEYGSAEAAAWLASAIEAAYRDPPPTRRDRIPINATVPAVSAADVSDVLARFPGARTAKVKVAEPGQTLADDVARVNAVRALVPTVRVDANGGWSVSGAVEAAHALTADGPLEYLEQPCATVPELAELRRRVDVPIAADESIRKADDPLHVVRSGAADIAVLKVAPLGGVDKLLDIAAADRRAGRGVQRAGLGRRHRAGTAGGRGAAGVAARLRAGDRRVVRRRRGRAADAGRRVPASRARDPGPGATSGAGRRARAPAVVDRPRHGVLSADVLSRTDVRGEHQYRPQHRDLPERHQIGSGR